MATRRREMDLVEREREVAEVEALVDEALEGDGRALVVEGPAGIGKSRLLAEARRRAAEHGALVLVARGTELEREFPFGVVRQLFEAALAGEGARERLLGGSAAPAATVVTAPRDAPDGAEAGEGGSFALLHGLFWLTLNLAAERPVAIAVDDLHWCDRSSLRFLAYLLTRLEGQPVLLAGTLRNMEPGTDAALLGELLSDPATTAVRPGPLSLAATTELVRARLGADADERFCAACHQATGGNPLLLRQLLRGLESEGVTPDAAHAAVVRDVGPGTVARTVLLRLARLPAGAAEVARAVAVLGEGAALSTVADLAGEDRERVAELTGALARAEILSAEPPLGFVHPLVRDAVYRDIAPGDRELRHARAALLLRDAGAAPEHVAAQLLPVPPQGAAWMSEVLEQAGHQALSRGDADAAVATLRRALDEPPAEERRTGVLLALGQAEAFAAGPAAIIHLREAHERLTDPVARGEAAAGLAKTLTFTGAPAEGLRVARAAALELPDGDLRDRLDAIELFALGWCGPAERDHADLDRYRRRLAVRDTTGSRMTAIMAAYEWANVGASAQECSAQVLEALQGGQVVAEDDGMFIVVACLMLAMADRPEGLAVAEQAVANAHRRGSLFGVFAARLWMGFALLRRGELEEAGESLESSLHDNEVWGIAGGGTLWTRSLRAIVRLERGELAAARAALGDPHFPGPPEGRRWYDSGHMAVLVAQGDYAAAVQIAHGLRERFHDRDNPAPTPWRSLEAEALDRLGRTDEALIVAHEDLALARAWGAPGALGRSLRVLGRLAGDDDGLGHLEESVAVLQGSTARLELAKSEVALGEALRRLRRPTDAREPLRRGLELADACGARPVVDQARTELYATGARPRSTALQGAAALTASERRVADLAAEGQSNRDIAQALFVTPKTVEVHLSNAYRKLGIRSRRELAGALAVDAA